MAAVVGAVVDGVVAGEEQVAAAAAVGWSTCSGLFFSSAFFSLSPFQPWSRAAKQGGTANIDPKRPGRKEMQNGFQKCHFLKQ